MIDYDKSHGVLAFIAYGLALLINLLLFDMMAPVAVFYAIIATVMLQAINESMQAIDPLVEQKYGTWYGFQHNSKRDWKYCILGLFMGLLLLTPLVIVLANLFSDHRVVG